MRLPHLKKRPDNLYLMIGMLHSYLGAAKRALGIKILLLWAQMLIYFHVCIILLPSAIYNIAYYPPPLSSHFYSLPPPLTLARTNLQWLQPLLWKSKLGGKVTLTNVNLPTSIFPHRLNVSKYHVLGL